MTIYSHRTYLQKQRFLSRQIKQPPSSSLEMVIVIPCFYEKQLTRTLDSLARCATIQAKIEVIVVVNAGEQVPEDILQVNQETLDQARAWRKQTKPFFDLHLIEAQTLPKKHAGVGLARKIGMDEAVDRFEQAGKEDGIIVCLDADSQVKKNYFQAIHDHFSNHPKTPAASLHFEHPLEGTEFTQDIYTGIAFYELYLRYYIEGLRFAGYPYAFHTIGSSMAVRSSAYQAQGGMNRRKAGEDFYFLHKFMPSENVTELMETTVIPSPRPSHRVPFGTGKAIVDWLDSEVSTYQAYDPQVFEELGYFLNEVPKLFDKESEFSSKAVHAFLEEASFAQKLVEIRHHTTQVNSFVKRFYTWFDGLKVLKFVHFARDHFYPNIDLMEGARILYEKRVPGKQFSVSHPKELLLLYRALQNPMKYE